MKSIGISFSFLPMHITHWFCNDCFMQLFMLVGQHVLKMGAYMVTVYDFELPKGYVDKDGEVHKFGQMRLATAGDEMSAARDPRVLGNPSYLTAVILSKVIVKLDGVEVISTTLIEKLFTADLAFLQDMYQRINNVEVPKMRTVCPDCGKVYEVPINFTTEG